MAQTDFPESVDLEEKPRAMLFDGWGFVPLPEHDAPVAPTQAEADSANKAPT